MVKDVRVTYRRRHSYNTKSNRVRKVKTPGGRLVLHYTTKPASPPKCGDCGVRLNGVASKRAADMKRLPRCKRTVSRAYGGNNCAVCVRNRILRAFIIEEQKIVKQVLVEKAKQAKANKA